MVGPRGKLGDLGKKTGRASGKAGRALGKAGKTSGKAGKASGKAGRAELRQLHLFSQLESFAQNFSQDASFHPSCVFLPMLRLFARVKPFSPCLFAHVESLRPGCVLFLPNLHLFAQVASFCPSCIFLPKLPLFAQVVSFGLT